MRRQALLLNLPLTLRRSSLGRLDHEWPFASTAMAFSGGQCTWRSSIPHQLVVSVATNTTRICQSSCRTRPRSSYWKPSSQDRKTNLRPIRGAESPGKHVGPGEGICALCHFIISHWSEKKVLTPCSCFFPSEFLQC